MSDAPDIETRAAADLDDQVRRADPDRWLSSRFVADPALRSDLIALYAFDHELARAPRVASNALLGEIRLTWWAEVLAEIFEDRPVRRHPTALALARVVRRRSLPRARLEAMVEARFRELEPAPMSPQEAVAWAAGSAGSAAALAAHLLDPKASAEAAAKAGQLWALALRQANRTPEAPDLAAAIRGIASGALEAVRGLSATAFPAVAHAALARVYEVGKTPSPVSKQLRLTWAVATGRI